jgi:hypothetical protein
MQPSERDNRTHTPDPMPRPLKLRRLAQDFDVRWFGHDRGEARRLRGEP